MSIRVTVVGAAGRMGQKNIAAVLSADGLKLTGASDAAGCVHIGRDAGEHSGGAACGIKISSDSAALLKSSDVIIDFSHHTASLKLLKAAAALKKAVILGTTGFSAEDEKVIAKLAKKTAVVKSGNFSLGINLLMGLVAKAAEVLEGYDTEIIEHHHRQKLDAPSGTAMMLAQSAAKALGRDLKKVRVSGRDGIVGKRQAHEIGVLAVRGGAVVGHHEVLFLGDCEKIELKHDAFTREAFTTGVIKAVRWVKGKKPGLYNMQDVLGL